MGVGIGVGVGVGIGSTGIGVGGAILGETGGITGGIPGEGIAAGGTLNPAGCSGEKFGAIGWSAGENVRGADWPGFGSPAWPGFVKLGVALFSFCPFIPLLYHNDKKLIVWIIVSGKDRPSHRVPPG